MPERGHMFDKRSAEKIAKTVIDHHRAIGNINNAIGPKQYERSPRPGGGASSVTAEDIYFGRFRIIYNKDEDNNYQVSIVDGTSPIGIAAPDCGFVKAGTSVVGIQTTTFTVSSGTNWIRIKITVGSSGDLEGSIVVTANEAFDTETEWYKTIGRVSLSSVGVVDVKQTWLGDIPEVSGRFVE